jgi:diguanylate cyclase (GGDEF)-like protein
MPMNLLPRANPARAGRLGRLILKISAALIFGSWVIGAWSAYTERSDLLIDERESLRRLNQMAAERTANILQSVRLFMLIANDWVASHPDADPRTDRNFSAIVQDLREAMRFEAEIRLLDGAGRLYLVPADPEATAADVSDREYFQAQSDPGRRGFFIGAPVRSRVNGQWGIPVSHPLPANRFGLTVISANIDLAVLGSVYGQSRPSADGTVLLVRADGVVLSRSPLAEDYVGRALADSAEWRDTVAAGRSGSGQGAAFADDGQNRLFAWLALDDFPLVVITSAVYSEVLHSWLTSVIILTALLLSFTIMILVLDLRLFRLLRQEAIYRAELEEAARIDALTGLYNRRTVMARAADELGRAGRYKRPVSLLALDLDFFKLVNDRHGHAAGDKLLAAFAKVLRGQVRDADAAGRIGGEEFLVLMPETDLAAAALVAERIRAATAALDTGFEPATVSIGAAAWLGPDESLDELLSRADAALYRAKAAGRDRVEIDR